MGQKPQEPGMEKWTRRNEGPYIFTRGTGQPQHIAHTTAGALNDELREEKLQSHEDTVVV